MALRLRPTGGYLDLEMARRALAIYQVPGLRVQVQALPSARFINLPWDDLDAVLGAAQRFADEAVYLTLNPILADRVRGSGKAGGCTVGDMAYRRWFFIDIDPVKPEDATDLSATDEEHARTLALAVRIYSHLTSQGWPMPLLIDSGNGHYLQYRVDLPNDPLSRAALAALFEGLKERFQGEDGKFDTTVVNANRLAKLPGCLARKGAPTPERPHRPCRILE